MKLSTVLLALSFVASSLAYPAYQSGSLYARGQVDHLFERDDASVTLSKRDQLLAREVAEAILVARGFSSSVSNFLNTLSNWEPSTMTNGQQKMTGSTNAAPMDFFGNKN